MSRLVLSLVLVITSFTISGQSFYDSISKSAIELTKQEVVYDPSYFSIDYPNGDIPANRGVCTDVIIRAYRKCGIDLQKEVHEDMESNFNIYPQLWGLSSTDKNIDHRRVPNLMTFFDRQGATIPISENRADYLSGDIVCWDLGGGTTHIGIVVIVNDQNGERNMIAHNIGNGQVMEDCLFNFKIIGHYRYNKYEKTN